MGTKRVKEGKQYCIDTNQNGRLITEISITIRAVRHTTTESQPKGTLEQTQFVLLWQPRHPDYQRIQKTGEKAK